LYIQTDIESKGGLSVLLIASQTVIEKLNSLHDLTFLEVEEAFNNFVGYPLVDDRSKHKSKPQTVWCLSETYDGRLLKLVFIPYPDKQISVLRTAYEPDDWEVVLWNENQ